MHSSKKKPAFSHKLLAAGHRLFDGHPQEMVGLAETILDHIPDNVVKPANWHETLASHIIQKQKSVRIGAALFGHSSADLQALLAPRLQEALDDVIADVLLPPSSRCDPFFDHIKIPRSKFNKRWLDIRAPHDMVVGSSRCVCCLDRNWDCIDSECFIASSRLITMMLIKRTGLGIDIALDVENSDRILVGYVAALRMADLRQLICSVRF